MKKGQSKIHNILNIRAIIDDAKCFQTVRELRWPAGVCCPHCTVVRIRWSSTAGMKPSRSASGIVVETVTGISMT